MPFSENPTLSEVVVPDSRRQGCDLPRFNVLMADDDEDDYILVKAAFEASQIKVDLRWVADGQEAMDYLLQTGKYMAQEPFRRPDLILLDIMMPRKDGLETLKDIKGHPYLKDIPVVLLTSSAKREVMPYGLKLGADSFIIKPHSLEEMIRIMGQLRDYYFGIVSLPEKISCSIFPPVTGRGSDFGSPRCVRCP